MAYCHLVICPTGFRGYIQSFSLISRLSSGTVQEGTWFQEASKRNVCFSTCIPRQESVMAVQCPFFWRINGAISRMQQLQPGVWKMFDMTVSSQSCSFKYFDKTYLFLNVSETKLFWETKNSAFSMLFFSVIHSGSRALLWCAGCQRVWQPSRAHKNEASWLQKRKNLEKHMLYSLEDI